MGRPRLDSLPCVPGSPCTSLRDQTLNPRPSDLKANVLCAVDPHVPHFMWQEFLASVQPPGFWINLSNTQLHAKIMSNRINNEQENFWKVGERETVQKG